MKNWKQVTFIGIFVFFVAFTGCKNDSNDNGGSTVATPNASPKAGQVSNGTMVILSTTTAGAEIWYNTNGSVPAKNCTCCTKYETPIAIIGAVIIKAIAVKDYMLDSGILEAAYTIPMTEVTFNVPDECTDLNKNKPITIAFPFADTTRQNAIKNKLIDTVRVLNLNAGVSFLLKAKINTILDNGLKITIEETNSLTYYMKVVDNQLVAETAYIEHTGVNGGDIAGTIILFINSDYFDIYK